MDGSDYLWEKKLYGGNWKEFFLFFKFLNFTVYI